jgi:hypothetical protein
MIVNYYASLYKAQKTVELLKKIKSAQQRVRFPSTGEKRNYSRNDLLKHNFKFQNTAVLRPRDQ